MANHESRVEIIGPWSGLWRKARKPFQCMNRFAIGGAPVQRCGRTICQGERYYDTCQGVGLGNYFTTTRMCVGCADRARVSLEAVK